MDREALKQQLGTAANKLGVELHEHMLDTIADLKTSAKDSIIRVGVISFVIGAVIGLLMGLRF